MLVSIWRTAPLCLMWCLWKKPNARSFEDCETGSLNLKNLELQTMFSWRVTLHSMSDCSFSNFLDLYSSSLWIKDILYTSYVLWVAPLYAF